MSGLRFRGVTPADGNCLFHAVSDQLRQLSSEESYSHRGLRAIAVACLKDHPFVVRTLHVCMYVCMYVCNKKM